MTEPPLPKADIPMGLFNVYSVDELPILQSIALFLLVKLKGV
ncbi:hypothetical protein CLV98_10410 [Dyadobacter jejuensis]|uniref:Uncharacterized protein n=1 Tax=Dyadobacter jejuensis TaxID=1082580 RepID=A0A316AK79_9BACT|nr:hypothetical protein CLV98_10410 [Dyadobacter jejuensis]